MAESGESMTDNNDKSLNATDDDKFIELIINELNNLPQIELPQNFHIETMKLVKNSIHLTKKHKTLFKVAGLLASAAAFVIIAGITFDFLRNQNNAELSNDITPLYISLEDTNVNHDDYGYINNDNSYAAARSFSADTAIAEDENYDYDYDDSDSGYLPPQMSVAASRSLLEFAEENNMSIFTVKLENINDNEAFEIAVQDIFNIASADWPVESVFWRAYYFEIRLHIDNFDKVIALIYELGIVIEVIEIEPKDDTVFIQVEFTR